MKVNLLLHMNDEHTTKSTDEITQSHVMFCSKFNNPVDDHILPFLHKLPKFPKGPVDFRYIAAGARSSLKPLSEILWYIIINWGTTFYNL